MKLIYKLKIYMKKLINKGEDPWPYEVGMDLWTGFGELVYLIGDLIRPTAPIPHL